MISAGTLLGLAYPCVAKADGRENSARGAWTSPSNQPLNMVEHRFNCDKRCGTGAPMSLIGSRASEQSAQIPDLIGFTRIAGRQRGRVGPQFSIKSRMRPQRRCTPWRQPRRIEKERPRPHSLKPDRLTGFRGGVA